MGGEEGESIKKRNKSKTGNPKGLSRLRQIEGLLEQGKRPSEIGSQLEMQPEDIWEYMRITGDLLPEVRGVFYKGEITRNAALALTNYPKTIQRMLAEAYVMKKINFEQLQYAGTPEKNTTLQQRLKEIGLSMPEHLDPYGRENSRG